VGTSGSTAARFAPVTPVALTLPALTSGNATGSPAKYIATCPDITSPSACGPPL
jgi:hypothetical protein